MKRVLTAVVLIPVVLLLVFRAPLWLFALAVAGIVVLTLREYLDIMEAYSVQPLRAAGNTCRRGRSGLCLSAIHLDPMAVPRMGDIACFPSDIRRSRCISA